MTKKIKTRDNLIPETADFVCGNCNTEFSSDEFEIISDEVETRDEKLPLFSNYNRIYWAKPVYRLKTRCPVCKWITEISIDRGLPEKKHEVIYYD